MPKFGIYKSKFGIYKPKFGIHMPKFGLENFLRRFIFYMATKTVLFHAKK